MTLIVYYTDMQKLIDNIVCGDCIEILAKAKKPFADLIFADPPFNTGFKYDKYNDKIKKQDYLDWSENWIKSCYTVLKKTGSFYIAIGDNYAAEIKILAENCGLIMRNWIIWHYTFGQQAKEKFARSHTHIFYFVKDENEFTFNDNVGRVLSDRQKIYKDKRANPNGKLPDDVWNEFPRICGTFEERTGWHPCQMPESILARIIRVSSNPNDLILDPFSGSGTTIAVARKLNRHYCGIDISQDYVDETIKRLKKANENPAVEGEGLPSWTGHVKAELKWLYHETKISTEKISDDPYILSLFTNKFNQRIKEFSKAVYTQKQISKQLTSMRKGGKLGPKEKAVNK